MEDILKLSRDLNIYQCCHIYREANRRTDCLAKKGICNTDSNIWWLDFPRYVRKFALKIIVDHHFIVSVVFFHPKKKGGRDYLGVNCK